MAYGDVIQPDQPVGSRRGPDGQWVDAQGNPIMGDVVSSPGGVAPTPWPGSVVGGWGTGTNEGSMPGSGGDGGGGGSIPPFSGVNYPGFTPPGLPASLQKPFALPTADDLINNDPGYMARYQRGQDAIQHSAAAQGTLLSGGTLRGLQEAGQQYAANEYGAYVQQKLGERQQQSADYLNLAYGPSWMQNQAATNQYSALYGQYKDLISNNRNAQQDYIQALLDQQRIGASATGAPPPTGTSNV